MTKALGVEWAPQGVRVNAVAPTFVRTPMTAAMLADPAFAAEVERRIPARRLASVTGSVRRVDGGWTAW